MVGTIQNYLFNGTTISSRHYRVDPMMLSFLQSTVWRPGQYSKVEVQNPVQLEVHQGRFSWEGLWIPLGNLLWVHWGSTGGCTGALWVHCGYTVGTLWVYCGYTLGTLNEHF